MYLVVAVAVAVVGCSSQSNAPRRADRTPAPPGSVSGNFDGGGAIDGGVPDAGGGSGGVTRIPTGNLRFYGAPIIDARGALTASGDLDGDGRAESRHQRRNNGLHRPR